MVFRQSGTMEYANQHFLDPEFQRTKIHFKVTKHCQPKKYAGWEECDNSLRTWSFNIHMGLPSFKWETMSDNVTTDCIAFVKVSVTSDEIHPSKGHVWPLLLRKLTRN